MWIALSAKIRVKYGRRLTENDLRLLADKTSVSAIADALKESPAYADALSDVELSVIHRGQLESLLRQSAWEEYRQILRYVGENARFLRYIAVQEEIEQILLFLTLHNCGKADTFIRSIPPYLAHSLSFDLYELAACTDHEAFLDLLSPTVYGEIVRRFPPDEAGQVPVPVLENALYTFLLDRLFDDLKRETSGQEQKELSALFGRKVDSHNADILFRLRLNFHQSGEKVRKFFLPHGNLLDEKVLASLSECPEEELPDAFRRAFGGRLDGNDPERFSRRLYASQLDAHRRLLHSDGSPAGAVVAYLELKQAEVLSLIRIIESVRYGIPKEKLFDLLSDVNPFFYPESR